MARLSPFYMDSTSFFILDCDLPLANGYNIFVEVIQESNNEKEVETTQVCKCGTLCDKHSFNKASYN